MNKTKKPFQKQNAGYLWLKKTYAQVSQEFTIDKLLITHKNE